MPGPYDPRLPRFGNEEGKTIVNFTFGTEGLLICMGPSPHGVTPSHEAWGLHYNHSSFASTVLLLSVKGFAVHPGNATAQDPPTLLSLCPFPQADPGISHLNMDPV